MSNIPTMIIITNLWNPILRILQKKKINDLLLETKKKVTCYEGYVDIML